MRGKFVKHPFLKYIAYRLKLLFYPMAKQRLAWLHHFNEGEPVEIGRIISQSSKSQNFLAMADKPLKHVDRFVEMQV